MRTLVLNAGYEPLAVVTFRRALLLVLQDKASILMADEDHPIQGVSTGFDRPSVILLHRYVRPPATRRNPVSRRGVLRRDAGRCAYCGAAATTIDHVLPRSRGGADSWQNLVACCLRCNNIKGDRTPAEMGWQLRVRPVEPVGTAWVVAGIDRTQPQWNEYLSMAAA